MWLLIPLLTLLVHAQDEFSIKGRIVEKGTRNILSGVNLFILPYKLKATTNDLGEFEFPQVPKGECNLVVNFSGYKRFDLSNICSQSNKSLNIYLEKISYNFFETTTTSKANQRDDQAHSLTQKEFLKAPGSFGGDPVRAAQNLPGVAQSGASARIIVQGASPDDTNYLIEGHKVPLVFHFGGLSSVIVPEAVERVDLLPSGYGPEYSRAMGGIIGLTTKEAKDDRFHGMAFVDLLNSGFLFEGPLNKKSSLLVSGRYSYIGQVLKAVAKENENFELTAAPTYYDFTSVYTNKLNDRNKFKTTIVASKDELELILNKTGRSDPELRGDFYNRTEFYRIIPQLETNLGQNTKMSNSLGIGKDSILVNINGRYLDVNSKVLTHRSELEKEWSSMLKSFFGLDNQINDSKVRINLPNSFSAGGVRSPFSVGDDRKFDVEQTQALYGAYIRQEIKTSEDSKWTYLPNLRFDHFSINGDSTLQPRFQLRHQWDPSLLLRASWGKYVQPPLPQEVSEYYGNKKIRSPYAFHYTTGFSKDFRKGTNQGFEFTNNYFYKELKDLIYPDIRKNYDNSGTGTIIGAEVQTKYQRGVWSGQVVYTYLKSRRNVPGLGTHPSEFDQTHNLNLIGARNWDKWTVSGRYRYVTGNPYTPIVSSSYDSDNDVFIPRRGGIFSDRFEDFSQLDIRIDRKYVYDKWILTAYLDIQNIFNSKNSQNMDYSYDYSQKKEVRGLPILPTVGVKGEF